MQRRPLASHRLLPLCRIQPAAAHAWCCSTACICSCCTGLAGGAGTAAGAAGAAWGAGAVMTWPVPTCRVSPGRLRPVAGGGVARARPRATGRGQHRVPGGGSAAGPRAGGRHCWDRQPHRVRFRRSGRARVGRCRGGGCCSGSCCSSQRERAAPAVLHGGGAHGQRHHRLQPARARGRLGGAAGRGGRRAGGQAWLGLAGLGLAWLGLNAAARAAAVRLRRCCCAVAWGCASACHPGA